MCCDGHIAQKCISTMYDSKYDSKMHDITIPLMGFNGFHHAGNKDNFDNFIGRESILDKLKAWLVDGNKRDNYSGAYLITGFRGMGKSAFVHKAIKDIKDNPKYNKDYYVPISINVGNDMLTSKELLYIICKLLSVKFDESTRWNNHHNFRIIQSKLYLLIARFLMFISALFFFLRTFLNKNILPDDSSYSYYFINSIFKNPVEINGGSNLLDIICTWTINYSSLLLAVCFILVCYFMPQIFNFLWKKTNCSAFLTTWQIKRIFRHLNERIDSEMTESSEYGIDSSKNSKPLDVVPGLRILKNKKNVYPIAQTSEIQDLLVKQLDLIKSLFNKHFRIIFIIDELDKVSPEDFEKQIVPEYNSANVINGNSTYNSRQRAFVGLLANMKYFISSSEAKFVFITGYDMYEATLADISNREFNLHSIFNGYINVSSFLRKTGKRKGADSMIEKYFCQFLVEPNCEKKEDLHDYVQYVKSHWEYSTKDQIHYNMLLERRIIFLRHFLTYLFYMSNGSPKKLAIYLEKYVRSREHIERRYESKFDMPNSEISDIILGVPEVVNKCEWFLSFDERNIHKIEFIAYLIYPMLKNLIAKSSIYNDKLLVSTSFMISNLYKFHKSGFSWRNLEYMPELLEINKTPELRDFIGGIMQFLNQTHVDEVVANLYMFEFPLRLSEEITYFSKTAEEVSYLFNFSHDELLSIKKLYNEQLNHYSKSSYESPTLASIHHMLGDIYMLEENYEQAIFEYNEALNAILRQKQENNLFDDTSDVLFNIRVTLKLGLAYEKRKTFDTAYITYDNLVGRILDIAEETRISQSCYDNQLKYHCDQTLTTRHNCYSSFFSNIHLAFLGLLAKIAVIEKMDLGGISEYDLDILFCQFKAIEKALNHKASENNEGEKDRKNKKKKEIDKIIRLVLITDFYTKLGDILFYKNGIVLSKDYKPKSVGKNCFSSIIVNLRKELELDETLEEKFKQCKSFLDGEGVNHNDEVKHHYRINAPCIACQCFNKSIKNCLEELNENIEKFNYDSRSLFFLHQLLDEKYNQEIVKKGNVFMMAMSNALVGMGNTLLGCIKDNDKFDIESFFSALRELYRNGFVEPNISMIEDIKCLELNHYAKSILYYLAAAKTYELLTDYKSAYNIYIQVLDAILVFYRVKVMKDKSYELSNNTLAFCEKVTERSIECTYLHYDSINCSEVDTQKHEMAKKHIEYVNLQALSSFPEIEVVIEKYYQLCLLGEKDKRLSLINSLLNSRQLGSYKLIATLTQNVQNLFFKITVNEAILSHLIPDLGQSLKQDDHSLIRTLSCIEKYFYSINNIRDFSWQLVEGLNDDQAKFCVLNHLVKDSLYCLNRIIDLISPLYSTTLYNNTFIGEIYEKSFKWNHILICLRELYEFVKADSKTGFISDLISRYSLHGKPDRISELEIHLEGCKGFMKNAKIMDVFNLNIDAIYEKINSESNLFQTSSYLMGNAIDYYSRAIEMHSSGKTYKEMITTLFFLEDDLHNDSNYMNLAIERFLLNHNIVQKRINTLKKKYSLPKSTLLDIKNYV